MATGSYTALSKYKHCPLAYKFEYVEHRKPTLRRNNRYFIEGSVIHNVLEDVLAKKRPLDVDLARSILPSVFDRVFIEQLKKGNIIFGRNENRKDVEKKTATLLELAMEVVRGLGLDLPDTQNEIAVGTYKAPFSLYPNLNIHGSADLVKMGTTSFDLYDLKTSKDTTYLDIDQLWIYLLCLEKMFNKPVGKAAFLMVREKKPIYLVTDAKNRATIEQKLQKIAADIDSGLFPANPSKDTCKDCLFRNQCPSSYSLSNKEIPAGDSGSYDLLELFDGKSQNN